ncbi:MAG: hypothetical protein MUO89_03440 [Dehalococcoidia bacterium]|nr:hypothetical protein [Dehalococcoidia bacterium]
MDRTLGPRNLGGILSETFAIYKSNFLRLVGVVAIVSVPVTVLYLIVELLFPAHGGGATEAIANGIFSLLLGLASSVAFILMGGAVIHAVSEQYLNQPINIGRAYSFAWNRLSDMFWAAVLAGLAIYGILVAATLISLFISIAIGVEISGWQGMMAWAAILILIATPPALYLGITWTFILQAALVEDCGPRAALSHSSALVKKSWWRVLGIVLLLVIIVMTITMIFYMPAIISAVSQTTTGFISYATTEPTSWTMIAATIGGLIGNIICIPIFTIGATLLYFDLRLRKQGYSLDALVNELGLTSAPADTSASPPQ